MIIQCLFWIVSIDEQLVMRLLDPIMRMPLQSHVQELALAYVAMQ
jgi:hypothetical protein